MSLRSPSQIGQDYDVGARNYDQRHREAHSGRKYRRIEETIRKQLVRGRVLDIGSGTGRLLKSVPAKRGVGIDISMQMLRNSSPGLLCAQADAQRLPFADESFDTLIAAQGVLRYIDIEAAMEEAVRVLRPGGRLAVHLYGAVFSVKRWSRLPSPLMIRDPQELVGPAEAAGLRSLRIELWRQIRVFPYAVRIPASLPGQLWTHCVGLFEKAA